MFDRQKSDPCCDRTAQEKMYPVCKAGQTIIFIGLGMAFMSLIFGFWLALLGAMLVLIGFWVIQQC